MVFLIKALQFFLAISILVALHEGGHFFFSKLFGVRVNKFYIFFDWKFSLFSSYSTWWRRLRGKAPAEKNEDGSYKYEGTEYGLGWIPLGGYCQIEGMIDETQHDAEKLKAPAQPWEFRAKPTWQRLLIMIGGVLVNFLLALLIYSMVLFTWGDSYIATKDMKHGMYFNDDAKAMGFKNGDILLGTDKSTFKAFDADLYRDLATCQKAFVIRDGKNVTIDMPGDIDMLNMMKTSPRFVSPLIINKVDSVIAGTPAERAGMKKGMEIIAVNGTKVSSWNDIDNEIGRLVDAFNDAKTAKDTLDLRTLKLVTVKDNITDTITVVADIVYKKKTFFTTKDVNAITMGVLKPQPGEITTDHYSFFASFPAGVKYGINILGGYVGDLKYIFTADGAKSLGGFGTIGSLFPPIWDWHLFWMMTAFLSIILAFMNILPIPALDGGHVLFLLYEMITRRKPSDKFMIYAEYFGFGILLLLMVVANLNDILREIGLM